MTVKVETKVSPAAQSPKSLAVAAVMVPVTAFDPPSV
jgi:hypothetical protein